MIKRILEERIKSKFFKGKVIIIVGPRQVGKTTLGLKVTETYERIIFNCDNPTEREILNNRDINYLEGIVGKAKIVFIDEAQKVETIGQTLKLLVDHYKAEKQIIVTGSSTINLLDNTHEPLTGRKIVFKMFPLSIQEIYSEKKLDLMKDFEQNLIFGTYPEVFTQKSFNEKIEILKELSASYLYKDLLEFQLIRNSSVIFNLLKALSLQIGNEVSYNELSNLLGIDKITVQKYVDLLEKSFIVFRLAPYTKNKRKEISKHNKIYFYDLGIRNAIINNFIFSDSRNDYGQLFENFCILERMKYREYNGINANHYFWRTYDGAEIDLVEEREGALFSFEFTLGNHAKKAPEGWKDYTVITKKDLRGFIL